MSRFVDVYFSLPLSERRMVCCIIDGEPISWRAAYEEIRVGTPDGQRIQAQLEGMGLI